MNNIIKKFKLKRKTANARKWKHKKGGFLKGYPSKAAYDVRLEEVAGFKKGGKAFVEGVNVLDSNPKAYKYVKKKYKMRSALEGTKVNWGTKIYNALNSDLGKSITGLVTNGIKTAITGNELSKAQAANNKALDKKYNPNNFIDDLAIWNEVDARIQQLLQQDPSVHYGEIDRLLMYLTLRTDAFNKAKQQADYQKSMEKAEYNLYVNLLKNLNTASLLDNISGVVGGIGNYLGNKSSNNTTVTTPSITSTPAYNYFNAPKKFGTFNSDGSMNLGYNMTYSTDKGIQTKTWSDYIFNKPYTDYLK